MIECTALFIGLGSIGCRHLRNLHDVAAHLGIKIKVDALRHSLSSLPEEIVSLLREQYHEMGELQYSYDMVFVCNPSQLHVDTLMKLKDIGKYFFVEKPISVAPIPADVLSDLRPWHRFWVACPLRHSAVYQAICRYVQNAKVYAVRAVCTSYLPDWRPGIDYKKLYSSRADSGGVKIDLVHEFDYLFSLFGFPDSSCLLEQKVSSLDIRCPDVAIYVGMYSKMSMEVHLDYFGRYTERKLRLWTLEDVVEFDFISGVLTSFTKGDTIFVGDQDRNDIYKRELESCLKFAVYGDGGNINDMQFANSVIKEVTRSYRCEASNHERMSAYD